jgi:UDPglucose--hexose-1-phosphate uridylyltransferase
MEVWVMPKQHITNISQVKDTRGLAEIMKDVLTKLRLLNAPYNYVLHYSPTDKDNLHFHIEILPRLSTWAGFEFNGTVINTVTPEDAAKFYRGEN